MATYTEPPVGSKTRPGSGTGPTTPPAGAPSRSSGSGPTTPPVGGGGHAPAPAAPAPPPTPSDTLSALLADFGISYPNAPAPTPALLAFVRGLGMNLQQSADVRRQGLGQVSSRTLAAHEDIARSAARGKQNITADLIRRGVLRSGEAGTRYGRQAEDVANKRADVERGRTEATQAIENAYEQARGTYRQQALERVLSSEEEQTTREAASKAQEESWRRQEEASQKAYQQQQAANEEYLRRMEELYKTYGAGGTVPPGG